MPLFTEPVAAFQRITRVISRDVTIAVIDTEVDLLPSDPMRKGHRIKNTGPSMVTVLYGIMEDSGIPFELYRVPLVPGDIYLYDSPEIIPYAALSTTGDGVLTVAELL